MLTYLTPLGISSNTLTRTTPHQSPMGGVPTPAFFGLIINTHGGCGLEPGIPPPAVGEVWAA